MSVPADGEITAAMLVLLDKPRTPQLFADPYFYVKELRLAVDSHLALEKILAIVEPLAEGFDRTPREAVVKVHKISEERERKVIVLVPKQKARALPTQATISAKGAPLQRNRHARTDSELAYLQDALSPELEEVVVVDLDKVTKTKEVKFDQDSNTKKTMSVVITNPIQIDHHAQAIGGGILKPVSGEKPDVKLPSSLEVLRQALGRPTKDWPMWGAKDKTASVTDLDGGVDDEPYEDDRNVTFTENQAEDETPVEVTAGSPLSADRAMADELALSAPGTPAGSLSATSSDEENDRDLSNSEDEGFELNSSDEDDFGPLSTFENEEEALSDNEDTWKRSEPLTPLMRKAFEGVTFGSVRPEDASKAMKTWMVKRWRYIALDLGVVVTLAVSLHLIGM